MHEPQINLLRMSGHTITETDGIYTVDGKFEIIEALSIIRDKRNPSRFIGFGKGKLVERFKRFEQGKEYLHHLVYIRNDGIEVVLLDKPYTVCFDKMKNIKSAGTHKLGVLKITQKL